MKGDGGENPTHLLWTSCPHLFHSRMDKEGQKPKTFVSTFRLALKPKASGLLVSKQQNDGLDTKHRTLTGSSNVEVSSSTGKNRKLTWVNVR